jgi:hypothetical protein
MRERRGFDRTLPPHYRLQRNPSLGHTRMVPADDYYVAAMFEDQARAFMTEGDNRVRADRLPNVYRRALLPSPGPGHRPDIPFIRVEVEEAESADDLPQTEVAGRCVRRAVDRFMSWASRLLRSADEEERRRLRADFSRVASDEEV